MEEERGRNLEGARKKVPNKMRERRCQRTISSERVLKGEEGRTRERARQERERQRSR